MGFVNGSAGYIETVGIGSNGKVTNTTKQGGLVAVYYFGAMFDCFIGGRFGDKFGRRKAVVLGRMFTLLGGALQAGSQLASFPSLHAGSLPTVGVKKQSRFWPRSGATFRCLTQLSPLSLNNSMRLSSAQVTNDTGSTMWRSANTLVDSIWAVALLLRLGL
jgi:MFS family permease